MTTTSLPPPNHAAYLTSLNAHPLTIEETADRYPNENELVIRVHAIAINQIDWKMQDEPWTDFKYPLILGVDVAGVVVHAGSEVNDNNRAEEGLHQFAVGDCVAGHALRFATGDDRHAGFQEYAVLWNNMTTVIPAGMPFERAAVLPLGVSTASAALFQRAPAGMGLELPTLDQKLRDRVSATRAAVLVWGATSSVGSNAVQMAVAAGYDVIATASRGNFETVRRRLGARVVIDYTSKGEDIVKQIREALAGGGHLVGIFDAIGAKGSLGPIFKIFEADPSISGVKTVHTTGYVEEGWELAVPDGLKVQSIQAIDIRGEEGDDRAETVGWKIYRDFLPKALEAGKYKVYPEPVLGGEGLRSIQAALETSKTSRKGKVVVTIKSYE